MTRDEAQGLSFFTEDDVTKSLDKLYDFFGSDIKKLEQQVAYWKLSFQKQCEATR